MKKLFIIANWKSNKTVGETEDWFGQFSNNLEIVLCPPFTLLYYLKLKIENLKLKIVLGAQDVSPFPEGAYTGEVSARMLKDLGVKYVIIGHSERRNYFKEDKEMLTKKVSEALAAGLIPVFCVQEKTTPVPDGVQIVAYEPLAAIGSGQPDSPENASEVAQVIKERIGRDSTVLYGGSVNEGNVTSFCRQENLNGVLVGGASLDANKFLTIIKNASQI